MDFLCFFCNFKQLLGTNSNNCQPKQHAVFCFVFFQGMVRFARYDAIIAQHIRMREMEAQYNGHRVRGSDRSGSGLHHQSHPRNTGEAGGAAFCFVYFWLESRPHPKFIHEFSFGLRKFPVSRFTRRLRELEFALLKIPHTHIF